MCTATYEAGVLAILPCRPKVVLLSVPSGCFVLISKGAPLQPRPQRASSSSKPSSQPRPPRPQRLTNAGLTGPSLTGDLQPRRLPWYEPLHRPMPRVGMTENVRGPLLTSTRSTPSRRPPRSLRLLTDQRLAAARSWVWLSIEKLSAHTSWARSVKTNVAMAYGSRTRGTWERHEILPHPSHCPPR